MQKPPPTGEPAADPSSTHDDDNDDDSSSDWDDPEERADWSGQTSKSASLAKKFDALVALDPLDARQLSQSASSSLGRSERRAAQHKPTGLSRDERATNEQVLDPRTRLLLFKMLNSGVLGSINGCVSTGKEANVYHAFGPDGELAVKVYKTSILVFKDRDRYVSGEFRWRHGYCRSNPRKMVRMWAEKELRNYRRMQLAGLPCPEAKLLREHVLVMSFIGEDGWNAPRLKDAKLSLSDAEGAWTWRSGCESTFANWAAGKPDNLGGTADCAALDSDDGEWTDAICSMSWGKVCVCDAAHPTPTIWASAAAAPETPAITMRTAQKP